MGEPDHEAATDELLTGWGRTAPSRASVWSPRPRRRRRAAGLERRTPWRPCARSRRSYGDAAQNAGGDVLRLAAHGPCCSISTWRKALHVEAGASLDLLMRALIPLGWFPTVVPGTRFVTVGGAIASDIHGKFGTVASVTTSNASSWSHRNRSSSRSGPTRSPTCSGPRPAVWV